MSGSSVVPIRATREGATGAAGLELPALKYAAPLTDKAKTQATATTVSRKGVRGLCITLLRRVPPCELLE